MGIEDELRAELKAINSEIGQSEQQMRQKQEEYARLRESVNDLKIKLEDPPMYLSKEQRARLKGQIDSIFQKLIDEYPREHARYEDIASSEGDAS